MKSFNDYLQVILKHEGGYVDNPSDPGGETKYGISKRSYPGLDIKNLTIEDASSIYYNDYWLKLNIDGINNEDLKLQLFDMVVNAGIKTSIKLLQHILGVIEDGVVGPVTIDKICLYHLNRGDIVEDYKTARINYYNKLVEKNPKLKVFIKGWINRVASTKFENE